MLCGSAAGPLPLLPLLLLGLCCSRMLLASALGAARLTCCARPRAGLLLRLGSSRGGDSSATGDDLGSKGGARGELGETAWQPDFRPFKSSFPAVTVQQWEELEQLALKLYDWNSKINLVSRQDVGRLVENHILPSLSISKVRAFGRGERVIDVGTGGGLPGLPLAIVSPQATFTLIDSNSKKMMVVADLVSALGLGGRVKVVKGRAEEHADKYDFLLGRAVSAIPNFLSFSAHLLRPPAQHVDGQEGSKLTSGLLYLKGGDFAGELVEAGISQSQLFPVSELVPPLAQTCDKSVLYVPAAEIAAFRDRHAAAIARAGKGVRGGGSGGGGGGGGRGGGGGGAKRGPSKASGRPGGAQRG